MADMALNDIEADELGEAARLKQDAQTPVEPDHLPAVQVRTTPPALGLDYLPAADELQRLERLADLVSRAGMVPASYRSTVAQDGRILQDRRPNVIVAALMGRTFGWDLLTAIRNIHVIEGAATLKPEALLGLIRARGHRVRIIRGENRVTVYARRADTGDEAEASFSVDDAYRAGLAYPGDNGLPRARSKDGKPLPWEQYPIDMCQWRAVSIVARGLFSDLALGLSYTPEELGAVVDADGSVVVESEAMPEPVAPTPADTAQPGGEQRIPQRPADIPPEEHRRRAKEHASTRGRPPTMEEALRLLQEQRDQAAIIRAQADPPLPPTRVGMARTWDAVRAYRPTWTKDQAQKDVEDELRNMADVRPADATAEQWHALAEEYEQRTDNEIRARFQEGK